MPTIRDKATGKTYKVSSKKRVSPVGSKRWKSYCARSAKIKGGQSYDSKNQAQRRRWKC